MPEQTRPIRDYGDVVEQGLILPKKDKYTMRDFNRLHRTYDAVTARFIIICSAAHHKTSVSDIFWNYKKFLYMPDG